MKHEYSAFSQAVSYVKTNPKTVGEKIFRKIPNEFNFDSVIGEHWKSKESALMLKTSMKFNHFQSVLLLIRGERFSTDKSFAQLNYNLVSVLVQKTVILITR